MNKQIDRFVSITARPIVPSRFDEQEEMDAVEDDSKEKLDETNDPSLHFEHVNEYLADSSAVAEHCSELDALSQ